MQCAMDPCSMAIKQTMVGEEAPNKTHSAANILSWMEYEKHSSSSCYMFIL